MLNALTIAAEGGKADLANRFLLRVLVSWR